jgi:D-glycero-alpha-D-manno-heptose-7-phosphate kinase
VADASQIVHPLVRESLAWLGIDRSIEIVSVAEIPARGRGLGSSSSFTVGLLNALHAFCGRHATAARLAHESCHIELERCREPIGKRDAYTAAYGGMNLIRFHPDETVEVKKVPHSVVAKLQANLLFFYARVMDSRSVPEHQSIDPVTSCRESPAKSEMVELAEDGFTELCEGRTERFGALLHANWLITEEMAIGISRSLIREAYLAARAAGAEGGRFLDFGSDGYLMFFAPQELHAAIAKALLPFRQVPFRITQRGSEIIFVH